MEPADIGQLVRAFADHRVTDSQVTSYCLHHELQRDELIDAFSRYVAHGFACGQLPYEECDAAMNRLITIADYSVPKYTWNVFVAFDEGEYSHPGDSPDLDPVVAYTRPAIAEILTRGE